MINVCIIGIAATILAVYFKKVGNEYSLYITLVACILIFILSINLIYQVVEFATNIIDIANINVMYIKVLLKITGITYLCEISSDVSKECGYIALSNQILVFGKLGVFAVSIPIFNKLIELVGTLLT